MNKPAVPDIIRSVFTVSRKTYITPHYLRVYFTGKDVPLIANTTVGINNKILIPPPGVKEVCFPEFDSEKGEWLHPDEAVRPSVRTYTHRGIDPEHHEIWIDFVVHGDEGPASAWAIRAQKGDRLGILMKNGRSTLYPAAAHYLLVGDATGIPVLGSILETLPPDAQGICILEVHGKEDEQPLQTRADIRFVWLHNPYPQRGSRLPEVVREQSLWKSSRFAYVAAEFSSVKQIRSYLRKELLWEREELYAYSYWKSGVSEDRSQDDRRAEKDV